MHRTHFQFGIPSASLPFSFRYAGKVDSEKQAWARIFVTRTCHPCVPLPFPFRCPSVVRVNPHDRACPCLPHVAPKWRTSIPGLQTPVTSQIPSVSLRSVQGFGEELFLGHAADDELSVTSPRRVRDECLRRASISLPFPFCFPSVMRVKLMP